MCNLKALADERQSHREFVSAWLKNWCAHGSSGVEAAGRLYPTCGGAALNGTGSVSYSVAVTINILDWLFVFQCWWPTYLLEHSHMPWVAFQVLLKV